MNEILDVPGIYCIWVDDTIVYIGESNNVLRRLFDHTLGIWRAKDNKYALLKAAKQGRYNIAFSVVEYCHSQERKSKETFWIHALEPILNSSQNNNRGKQVTVQDFFNYLSSCSVQIEGIKPQVTLDEVITARLSDLKYQQHRKKVRALR